MAVSRKSYRYCFVPHCRSTTTKNPGKLFYNGPKDPELRNKWFTAARRDTMLGPKTTFACCEDHFDEEDVENTMEYKMGLVSRLFLKKGVIPHIFTCQEDRTMTHKKPPRTAVIKRKQKSLVEDALSHQIRENNGERHETSAASFIDIIDPEVINHEEDSMKCSKDFSSQVNMGNRNMRCKALQCSPATISVSTSPLKRSRQFDEVENSVEPATSTDRESYSPSKSSSEDNTSFCDEVSSDFEMDLDTGDLVNVSIIVGRIKAHPRIYIGLPLKSYCLIGKLCEFTKCREEDILLTLKKIRLNEQFEILGHDFGCSKSQASRIFSKVLPLIANYLLGLVIWPQEFEIKMNLPIPFRARYGKVQSIIDCFEIEIEKPSNPVSQALTWSEYKKCNTLKYLVSCTPDGIVNFISKGYGGRASDALIVENCGYLNHLPVGAWVMADRGFKHIDGMLQRRGCNLVRPPSVASGEQLSCNQVRETKRIAGLRIHVERVISRLREFRYLVPHSCLSHNVIPKTDEIVIVACALINCQGRII